MTKEELKEGTFIGVVEDNQDPRKLGRVKVRVINVFDEIPKEDLPWAFPRKDLNGNEFKVPDIGKVVTVKFDNGSVAAPEYIAAEHYNINLEKKLSSLSGKNYTSMRSVLFDHKTQIYSNDQEGLMIDYKFNNINIKESSISVNLKDNNGKLSLGDENADQQAILGTNFMDWFDEFVDNLLGSKSGPYLGNMGSPVIPNPSFIDVLNKYKKLRDPKFLSNNVYINSNYKISTVSDNSSNRQNNNQLGDIYKSITNPNPERNSDASGDYGPQIDPNNDANITNDPTNTDNVPSTRPVYIDPNVGPNSGIISEFAKEMVRISQTQIGIFEKPRNSNSGPEVEGWYQRSTWLSGTGFAWCAAFICYLFKKASEKPGIKYSFQLPKTAGAFDFENWARNNISYVEIIKPPFNKILPGDIIIFNFSHIGISIGSLSGGKIDCIEGNTDESGSREGGGVYRKSRRVSLIKTVLRLKYNPNLVTTVSK